MRADKFEVLDETPRRRRRHKANGDNGAHEISIPRAHDDYAAAE